MKKNRNEFVALSQNEMMEVEGGMKPFASLVIKKTVQFLGKYFS